MNTKPLPFPHKGEVFVSPEEYEGIVLGWPGPGDSGDLWHLDLDIWAGTLETSSDFIPLTHQRWVEVLEGGAF